MSRNANGKVSPLHPAILVQQAHLMDNEGEEAYPTLMSLLKPVFKDETCVRLGGSISIRVAGAYYLISVNCPSEKVQTKFTCGSLTTLVADIERIVSSGTTAWLPDFESTKKARQEAKKKVE